MVEVTKKKISLVKKINQNIVSRQQAPKVYEMNASIYFWKRNYLLKNKIDTIMDDTEENISSKMKKFNLIGIPYQIIVGKNTDGEEVEFKEIGQDSQKINIDRYN